MPTAGIETLLQAGAVAALGGLCALLAPRGFRWRWLLVAVLLVATHDALLVRLYGLVPAWPPGSRWNWTGKWLAVAGMLGVAALPWFGWRPCGIVLRQAVGAGAGWWTVGVLSVLLLAVGWHHGDGGQELDTILFQWTMPGIEEELFYRGVLLLALNAAFRPHWEVLGARIGWGGILSTVAFGLVHALAWREGAVAFDAVAFLITGGPALLLLWLRERTGSLLAPVLAHNVVNGAFVIF